MKKQVAVKLVVFSILSIFVLSLGLASYAIIREPDSINWTYIHSCGCLFEETDEFALLECGVSTRVGIDYNAVAIAEVQQLQFDESGDADWVTVYTFNDENYMATAAEEYVEVDPGNTYRLKTTHQAKDSNGNVVETHVRYSHNIVVAPSGE